MGNELIGFAGLAAAGGVTMLLGLRYPQVSKLLSVVFVVLVALTLYDHFVAHLPFANPEYGQIGAHRALGAKWSREGLRAALQYYTGPDDYFYGFTIALLYSITGESVLLVRAFSVLAGVLTVFFGWILARELWGGAALAGRTWAFLLSPMALLYLSMTRREPYITVFLVLGLWLVVRYCRTGKLRYAGSATLSFYAGYFYHGPIVLAAGVFLVQACVNEVRLLIRRRTGSCRKLMAFGLTSILLIGAFTIQWEELRVPKLGTVTQAVRPMAWAEEVFRVSERDRDHPAAFPTWTVGTSPTQAVALLPLRSAYFLFGPFPWATGGLGGLLFAADGLIYMAYAFLIWRNRRSLWRSVGARTVLLILLVLIVAYAVGTGEHIAAMRHRMKLLAGLVALAVPMLPRLSFRIGPRCRSARAGRSAVPGKTPNLSCGPR